MNKKEVCLQNESFAYYSGLNGLEFKYIEHGIDDYIYCVSGCWRSDAKFKGFHKLKIYRNGKRDFIRIYDRRIYLDECVRM